MRVDLHLHTTASDGSLEPGDLVRAAAKGGLDLIAVTDHDTTAGVDEASRAGAEWGVAIVPGVELSTTWGGRDLHVLGYFVDPGVPALVAHQARAIDSRRSRMEVMVSRLRGLGLGIDMDAVTAVAGAVSGRPLGRPHLAEALVRAGHVASQGEAFHRYIGDDGPAFVPTELLDPVQGVELVASSGGAAVWAHPPEELLHLLPELRSKGLVGLEVYRPGTPAARVARLEAAARASKLIATGGSDWHSHERNGELGSFYLPGDRVAELLALGPPR